jgi:hypothetical protein
VDGRDGDDSCYACREEGGNEGVEARGLGVEGGLSLMRMVSESRERERVE